MSVATHAPAHRVVSECVVVVPKLQTKMHKKKNACERREKTKAETRGCLKNIFEHTHRLQSSEVIYKRTPRRARRTESRRGGERAGEGSRELKREGK